MRKPELPEDNRETRALRVWLLAKGISTQKPFPQMLAADAATLVRLFRGHLRVQGESRTTGNLMCLLLPGCCLPLSPRDQTPHQLPLLGRLLFPFVGHGPALTMSGLLRLPELSSQHPAAAHRPHQTETFQAVLLQRGTGRKSPGKARLLLIGRTVLIS